MDDPQIITTPGGEELVVLPRKDYEALVEALAEAEEELADIAILDRRLAELKASGAPNLPPDLSAFILKGFNRLSAIRQWRGLSVADVSHMSAIDEATLIALEARVRPATTEEAERLAKALDVPFAWLEP